MWHPGLRLRILVPAALVAIPAIALLVYTSLERRAQAEQTITQLAERLATNEAAENERLFDATHQLLIAAAHSRDVRGGDPEICSAYFKRIAPEVGTIYNNLGVLDPKGALTCSAFSGAAASFADRDYFQRAFATSKFVVGEYIVDRQTGKPSLPFAYPVVDETGVARQVVFAVVDLGRLSENLASPTWPAEASVIITDRNHRVLAVHPPQQKMLGQSLENGPLTLAMGPGTSGTVEHIEHGVAEVMSFRRVAPLDSGVIVRVYVTKTPARAAAAQTMYRTVFAFAVAACLIMLGAHLAADRLLVRPIAQLTSTARLLAAGDLGARAAASTTIPELRELAENFDNMAAAIEEREKERLLSEMGRQELEQQYHQSQKMDAVGRLAGGIAHDFNNMLTAILGYCELLLEDPQLSDSQRDDLLEIQKAGKTAAQLTRQLLAFSRREIVEPGVVDVNAIVSSVEKMLQRLVGEHIEIHAELAENLHAIKADRGQLEQVILNLAVNARDAMPEGGRMQIETANVYLPDGIGSAYLSAPPGEYVMLSVSDTGTGIKVEVLNHLFEPFFTTKATGKGTGLGLATIYGIVKQSNGGIVVASTIGRGSVFRLYFPRCSEQITREAAAPASERTPDGKATVLIVEDDPGIRELSAKILGRYGYTVLVAAGGEEARDIAQRHAGRIHVLLSDVVMPGMNGPMVADMLTRMRPELKVIFMSGYTDDAIVRHGVMERDVPFLQKPFTPERLANKIVEVLG